jgi:hypothetical protein
MPQFFDDLGATPLERGKERRPEGGPAAYHQRVQKVAVHGG